MPDTLVPVVEKCAGPVEVFHALRQRLRVRPGQQMIMTGHRTTGMTNSVKALTGFGQ